VNASPLLAAVYAMVATGIAGEIAGEKAAGPGSFQMHFLDALSTLDQAEVEARIAVERAELGAAR
jgi:hydroxyethylthiazole kinase